MHAFEGELPGIRLGEAVAGAGDVDGDGFADAIVGAPHDYHDGMDSGSARVHSGADGRLLFAFRGDGAGCELGRAVGSAGDVDGDGSPDLLVSYAAGPNGPWSGGVRVFSGATGVLLHELHGDAPYDGFGAAIAGVGDVDGDGRADFVVGAPRADANQKMDCGIVRVFSGAGGGLLLELHGGTPLESFGAAVCGLGDVDQDGRPDFAVGAPCHDTANGVDAGRVTVYSGLDGSAILTVEGWSYGAGLGTSVALAGDVDLDGWPDLLAGAPFEGSVAPDGGNVQLVSGRTGARLHEWYGQQSDRLGTGVAGLGDLDGDGHPELASSCGDDDPGASEVLRVHSGRTYALLFALDAAGGDRTSARLVALGDANGDGIPDLLVGAPRADGNGTDPGAALVLSGGEHVVAFCFGDGGGTPCGCINPGGPGEGCANSTGAGGVLGASGSTSLADDALRFDAVQLAPSRPALLFAGTQALNQGLGHAFGDGLRCVSGDLRRLGTKFSDASGAASWGRGLLAPTGWSAGETRRFQVWYRDPAGPCGSTFNTTNAIEVVLSS